MQQSIFFYTIGGRAALYDLLRRFSMSVEEFRALNPKIDLFCLSEGDVVRVRDNNAPKSWMHTHVVEEGECFCDVCQKYQMPPATLTKLNPHLYPADFKPGVTVFLP